MANYFNQTGHHINVALFIGEKNSTDKNIRLDGISMICKYLYIKKGTANCMIEGETHGSGNNSLIFIPSGCPHHIALGHNTVAYYIAIPKHINLTTLPTHPKLLQFSSMGDITHYLQMFDTCLGEYNSKYCDKESTLLSYINLITVKSNRIADKNFYTHDPSPSLHLMRRFSRLVEKRYYSEQMVNNYARDLGVTPTHLTRVCQHYNKLSASQYIQNRIIREATNQLKHSDEKIHVIAKEIGFNSSAYFSRFFRKKTGICPRAYRRNHGQEKKPSLQDV